MNLSLGDFVSAEAFAESGGVLYRVDDDSPSGHVAQRQAADFFGQLEANALVFGGSHIDRLHVERMFEAIRTTEYSSCISRTSCTFANITVDDAQHWKQAWSRSANPILIIRPLPNSKLQVVDVGWFNLAMRIAERVRRQELRNPDARRGEIEDFARHYWTGADSRAANGTLRLEVLMDGSWEVRGSLPASAAH